MSIYSPYQYETMVNKYLNHQKSLQQPHPKKDEEPSHEVHNEQQTENHDETIKQLRDLISLYETKEQKQTAKKAISIKSKLKGEEPSSRAEKMRNAKVAKKQTEENDLLEECMDKDLKTLKKEKTAAQSKVRLLKKFTNDIEKYA